MEKTPSHTSHQKDGSPSPREGPKRAFGDHSSNDSSPPASGGHKQSAENDIAEHHVN